MASKSLWVLVEKERMKGWIEGWIEGEERRRKGGKEKKKERLDPGEADSQ